jgi:hypothetical protein
MAGTAEFTEIRSIVVFKESKFSFSLLQSIYTLTLLILIICSEALNTIYLVFAGCRAIWWALKKVTTFLNSALTKETSSSKLSPDANSVVSSANNRVIRDEHSGKSFTYIKNNRGPKMEP